MLPLLISLMLPQPFADAMLIISLMLRLRCCYAIFIADDVAFRR